MTSPLTHSSHLTHFFLCYSPALFFPSHSQRSRCDLTLFSMMPECRSEEAGNFPSQSIPAEITMHVSNIFKHFQLHFQCHACSCFSKIHQGQRNSSCCIRGFRSDSSVGAEAGSWSDAAGLILYSMLPVVFQWAKITLLCSLRRRKLEKYLCSLFTMHSTSRRMPCLHLFAHLQLNFLWSKPHQVVYVKHTQQLHLFIVHQQDRTVQ